MTRKLLDFKPEYDRNSSGPNGYLLEDSTPLPANQGSPQAGDTTGNPDLGRRRPDTLRKHFDGPDLTSSALSTQYWEFIQASIQVWADNAPALTEITLEGTETPPGLNNPLCPNLTAIVEDPEGPQTIMGGSLPNPNSSADTAGQNGVINAHRDPVTATANRITRGFIEGRKTRWS